MFVSTSCSVFLALGQLIFQKRLETNLSAVVTSDLVHKVISAGATNFRALVPDADLTAVVKAYGKSCTQVFVSLPPPSPMSSLLPRDASVSMKPLTPTRTQYLPAAAPAISFAFACGCQWISTKKKPSDTEVGETKEVTNP